jgi:hypothetical protein
VIQPARFTTAVQGQVLEEAMTVILPDPPLTPKVVLWGEKKMAQDDDRGLPWETVKVLPAIVIVPRRGLGPGLAATV